MKKVILAYVLAVTSILSAGDFRSLKMINAGIGGNNTRQGLKRFERDALKRNPDMMIIFFGMNDAVNDHNSVPLKEFKINLATMLDKCARNNIIPVLVTVHHVREETLYARHKDKIESFYKSRGGANKIIDSYDVAIRNLAKEKKIALVDFAEQAAAINKKAGENVIVRSDGVHLSQRGKDVLGAMVAEELKKHPKSAKKVVCFGDSITYYGYMREVCQILDPLRFPIYSTNIKSAKRHLDTTPPSKLFDGRTSGISSDSVEYPGDVEISIDLRQPRMISTIDVVGFNGGDHKISEITLYAGNDKSALKKIATVAAEKKYDRKAKSYAFKLNKKIRYLKVVVKKDASAKRLLLSEVVIND